MKKSATEQSLTQSKDVVSAKALDKLKKAGHRITKSRQQILHLLETTKKALSPAELYQLANQEGSELDRVTVYRILEAFEELEIVHPVGNGRFIYCAHQSCGHDRHFIAICKKCGDTSEVGATSEFSDSLAKLLKKEIGFKMTSEFFVVHGICKSCL